MTSPYRSPSVPAESDERDIAGEATLVGGYRAEFLFSALIAGFGAFSNYAFQPFPSAFYSIVAAMAVATSLTVMFTLTGPTLSFEQRIGKAVVPGFFGFLGLMMLISIGIPIVRVIGETYFAFDFASDGFANGFGMIFLLFYPAVLFVMFLISGSQLAKYNDPPDNSG